MTELVRTSGGNVIHRVTCRYAATQVERTYDHSTPWKWAEGRSYVEVRMAATRFRLKLCKVCKPADGAGIVGETP